MVEYDFGILLRALLDAGVEFVVVGGLSATLNGVPVQTFDVDVVHSRTPANVDRLLPVLNALDAVYRIQPERRRRPVRSALLSTSHQNLLTKNGPLDLLGTIGNGLGYEELVPRSTEILIEEDLRVRILKLETLIEVKEQLDGEKDRAMLPLLRRTLEEKKQNCNPDEK
jgi:predicted nucleotidyltransferase